MNTETNTKNNEQTLKIQDVQLNKVTAKQFAAQTIQAVQHGELDALKAYSAAYMLNKAADEILKGVREMAVDYVDRYGGSVIVGDTTITTTETAVRYDYSASAEWVDRAGKIQALQDAQKALETRMRTASAQSPFYDAYGTEISGVGRRSTTSLKFA